MTLKLVVVLVLAAVTLLTASASLLGPHDQNHDAEPGPA
jgi:hypothetical protein